MKCIKKDNKIKRVKNDIATQLVDNEDWQYCPKSEWKEQRQNEQQQESKEHHL